MRESQQRATITHAALRRFFSMRGPPARISSSLARYHDLMLTCLPKSLCSRNFRVIGVPEGKAEVDFDSMSEQGTISMVGEKLRVRKHGAMSGRWTLEREGEVLAEASKPSAMTRSIEIQTLGVMLSLDAKSSFSNEFILSHDGTRCGSIRPMHSFTRRAYVECDAPIDSTTQLFAFWMVALMWRRAENAAAAS